LLGLKTFSLVAISLPVVARKAKSGVHQWSKLIGSD
jgi:hypothetical protein